MIPLNPDQVAEAKAALQPEPLCIHEASHVALAHKYGWEVEEVTVNPSKSDKYARSSKRRLPPEEARIGNALRADLARYEELVERNRTVGLEPEEAEEADTLLKRLIGAQAPPDRSKETVALDGDYYVIPEDSPEQKREYIIPRVMVKLAGLCAEEHFFGTYGTEGAAEDERIARDLVAIIANPSERDECFEKLKADTLECVRSRATAIRALAVELKCVPGWTLSGDDAFQLLNRYPDDC